jgi:ribosomal protein S18 acetylase RimI-like enzyme
MAEPSELSIMTCASADLERRRRVLIDVYEDVYRQRLGDPFFSTPRYWDRLHGYASRRGFSIKIGAVGTIAVGYALGYTLPEGSGWWRGLKTDRDEGELAEDGHRTFALTEIMVREQWRRRGYAHQLHDALLAGREEERATLLVLPDNLPAKAAYASWGWRKMGELKPFDDSPTYDAMVIDLTLDFRST